jgi:Asp-tRNA(Asn)/Glu-tRNA(Gln) amidotransferase C subunit
VYPPVPYILSRKAEVRWEPCRGTKSPNLSKTTILSSLQIRQQMEEQVAQKSSELEQYLQRVRELEDMYLKLQEALEDERQARQDEETVRKLQARCRWFAALSLGGFACSGF